MSTAVIHDVQSFAPGDYVRVKGSKYCDPSGGYGGREGYVERVEDRPDGQHVDVILNGEREMTGFASYELERTPNMTCHHNRRSGRCVQCGRIIRQGGRICRAWEVANGLIEIPAALSGATNATFAESTTGKRHVLVAADLDAAMRSGSEHSPAIGGCRIPREAERVSLDQFMTNPCATCLRFAQNPLESQRLR